MKPLTSTGARLYRPKSDFLSEYTSHGGRGVYFKDPNTYVLEIITTDYVIY